MASPQDLPDIVAELGALVGIPRPAGRCFAAIWRAARPPCADDLTAALGLSRSNVSTALRDLREWGLISRVRAPADRKDYFTAPPDPWEVLRLLIAGWQRRALAPLLDRLAAEAAGDDIRARALRDTLATLAARLEGLAALDPDRLAASLAAPAGAGAGEDRAEPRKKKKKKKG